MANEVFAISAPNDPKGTLNLGQRYIYTLQLDIFELTGRFKTSASNDPK